MREDAEMVTAGLMDLFGGDVDMFGHKESTPLCGKNKALEETTRLHKIKGSFSFYTCSVFVYMRKFHSYITTAGEELQILIYAGHSWPLSSESSSICHTCCDTWLPFTMVISEDVSEIVGRRF